MTKPRLHVIHGRPAPDTPRERVLRRVRAAPKPAHLLQCHRCGGREFIETRTGVMRKAGKSSGGTKLLICALCLLRGERVVVP